MGSGRETQERRYEGASISKKNIIKTAKVKDYIET
jgi:hypothetical protein